MDDGDMRDKFFDSHIHLYNLSHVGFLAYLNRVLLNQSISLQDIIEKKYGAIVRSIIKSLNLFVKIIFIVILIFLLLLPFIITYFISTGIYRTIIHESHLLLLASLATCFFIGILIAALIFYIFISWFKSLLADYTERAVNMVSIIENDTASILMYLELDFLYLYLEIIKDEKEFKKIMDTLISKIKNKIKTRKSDNLKDMEKFIYPFIRGSKDTLKKLSYKKEEIEISRIILTPLMMDFRGTGYDGSDQIYYNLPPNKPIVEQVIDLFNGLKFYHQRTEFHLFEVYPFMGISPLYYDYDPNALITIPGDLYGTYKTIIEEKMNNCFTPDERESCISILSNKIGIYKKDYPKNDEEEKEHYIIVAIEKITDAEKDMLIGAIDPGIGNVHEFKKLINKIWKQSNKNSIQKLFYKYFGDYEANDTLYEKYYNNYQKYFRNGAYTGNIDSLRSYFFAGVKLYPALGYDPWPKATPHMADMKKAQAVEQLKVEFLYSFCEAKQIPITVHCQNSSFGTIDKKIETENTHPAKWRPILEKFSDLKINFAHMGLVDKEAPPPSHEWTETIVAYMKEKKDDNPNEFKFPNVFVDFACKGKEKGKYNFYSFFDSLLKKYEADGVPFIKERILFGSDFPLQLFDDRSYKTYLQCFLKSENCCFTDEEKKLIYNINPARFIFNIHI